MAIIIRSVFEKDSKLYLQVLKMLELIFQKGLVLIKQIYQKNVVFVTIGILKILV